MELSWLSNGTSRQGRMHGYLTYSSSDEEQIEKAEEGNSEDREGRWRKGEGGPRGALSTKT